MKNKPVQPNLRQIISIHLLVWLMSFGFAFGQSQDERKLELVVQTGHSTNTKDTAQENPVLSVKFSPDNKLLASSALDGMIKLWNIENSKEIRTILIPPESDGIALVNSFTFDKNGEILASAIHKGRIKLWNIVTGKEIQTLSGNSESTSALTFSSDGKFLASVSWDKTIKIWDVVSGKLLHTINTDLIIWDSFEFSIDGKLFAGVLNRFIEGIGGTKEIKIWNLENKEEQKINCSESLLCEKFEFNNKFVITANNDKKTLWDFETGQKIAQLSFHSKYNYALSSDGKFIAFGDSSSIKIWDTTRDKEIKKIVGFTVFTPKFISSNGKILVSSDKNTIKLFDIDKKQVKTIQQLNNVEFLRFSPDSKILASIDGAEIKLWNTEDVADLKTLSAYSNSFLFTPDSEIVITGTGDNLIKYWDVKSGKAVKILKGHTDEILDIGILQDSKTLASRSDDGTVILWDLQSGKLLKISDEKSLQQEQIGVAIAMEQKPTIFA